MVDQDNIPVTEDILDESTPELAAVSKENEQPVEVPVQKSEIEVLREEKEALQAKADRYLQQLHGKDKLIEDLKASEIAKNLERPASVVEDDTYEYEPETPQQPRKVRSNSEPDMQTKILVKSAISMNKNSMAESFSNDSVLPWNKEIAEKVEKEIIRRDPSRISVLDEEKWETTYHLLRSQAASEKLADQQRKSSVKAKVEADKLAKVIIEKEKAKQSQPVIQEAAPTKQVAKNTEFEKDSKTMTPEQLKRKYREDYNKAIVDRLWG
jgi:hypothetical protein